MLASPTPTPMRASANCVKAARQTGQRRHRAPEPEPDRDEPAPIPHVGQAPEWNAEDRVEDRERGAVQEPDLRVAQLQIGFDALGEDGEDLAIDEVEDVDDDEHTEDVPGVRAGRCWRGVLVMRTGRRAWPCEAAAWNGRAQRAVCAQLDRCDSLQWKKWPPLTSRAWPVMTRDRSEAKNTHRVGDLLRGRDVVQRGARRDLGVHRLVGDVPCCLAR